MRKTERSGERDRRKRSLSNPTFFDMSSSRTGTAIGCAGYSDSNALG